MLNWEFYPQVNWLEVNSLKKPRTGASYDNWVWWSQQPKAGCLFKKNDVEVMTPKLLIIRNEASQKGSYVLCKWDRRGRFHSVAAKPALTPS